MNLGFIMVGLVFLISIPSNSSTTIKNKENPWSYCYSDDLRFLQSKKEGRGISVFLYTRCTEQKYKLLIQYSIIFVFLCSSIVGKHFDQGFFLKSVNSVKNGRLSMTYKFMLPSY